MNRVKKENVKEIAVLKERERERDTEKDRWSRRKEEGSLSKPTCCQTNVYFDDDFSKKVRFNHENCIFKDTHFCVLTIFSFSPSFPCYVLERLICCYLFLLKALQVLPFWTTE